ncbi:OLC1v1030838C1 [Oldenlandia corymbosa var. corymbosa]|uniref:OLC1v1030838C1 n=1 Tax=Oldenlandia corymbosa var. corymbosa TaxID=529605 RepID=A0AAV1CK02_OLDCO|nr:OLC1v1030838C1 [Oldenlandia corymbosa var. corymbosa]
MVPVPDQANPHPLAGEKSDHSSRIGQSLTMPIHIPWPVRNPPKVQRRKLDVPDSSLLLESGTRDMHGRVISASYHRGSPTGYKLKGKSQKGHADSSVGSDDVFDHASLDLQNVSDNDDIPTEDIDSEGFNDFGGDSPPHSPPYSPPARRSNIIRLRVRGLEAASASASATASSSAVSNAQPWVVTRPVIGGPHDGSVIPSFLGHVAHRLTDKSYKPSLEMDTRVTYFKLMKERKGSMSTEAQILLAGTRLFHIVEIMHTNIDKILGIPVEGRLITAQPGTVDSKTLVMRALRMTSQTLQTRKVIHGGGVQSGIVAKTGRAAALALDQVTAWLWVMLRNTLFTDMSGTQIRAAILSEFIDGLVTRGNISWRSTALAYLYHQLGMSTRLKNASISGYYTLLQAWIYLCFPCFRPVRGSPFEAPDRPQAEWWNVPNLDNSPDRLMHLRNHIDKLTPYQVEWLPYGPDPVSDDPRTIYSGWIQYRDIIEPYLPSRVLRQIGYIQVIPPPIPHPPSANRSGNHHAYKVSWRPTETCDAWMQFPFSTGLDLEYFERSDHNKTAWAPNYLQWYLKYSHSFFVLDATTIGGVRTTSYVPQNSSNHGVALVPRNLSAHGIPLLPAHGAETH